LKSDNRCARCGEGTLKSWLELTEDEQEVVKRLPGAAKYGADERKALHVWCTNCWDETSQQPMDA